jgi:biotin carboxylase
VLTPTFLSASRGVIRADDRAQFDAARARIAAMIGRPEIRELHPEAAKQILVEEFVPGPEVALEGILEHGQLRVLALFDKPDPLDGPFFEETIYVTPSRLPAAMQEEIARVAAAGAAALGLTTGPVHAELRGTTLIEIAARSIGGLCARTLRFGAGLSLEDVIIGHAVGRRVADERAIGGAGVMMIPIPTAGVLREVRGVEAARAVPHIEDVVVSVPLDHELVPLPEGASYLGFLFARADTPEAVCHALRDAHARLVFVITPLLPVA